MVYCLKIDYSSREVQMYQELTLSNGARILLERVAGARSAALGFFVGAGSRHESAVENGAAHFIGIPSVE